MEGPSAATKRGAKAVSRRGAQAEEIRPLTLSAHNNHGGGTISEIGSGTSGKANLPAPPRSGQFLHAAFSDMAKDDHPKRRYRVNLPYRMLYALAVVFLMIPLIIFLYKESHLHREHDHYKPQRYVNVKTKDVLSQFSDHAHGTAAPPLTEGEDESPDEEEAQVEEKKLESPKSPAEPVPPPPIPATEAKEETQKEPQEETADQDEQEEDPKKTKAETEKELLEGESTPNDEATGKTADGEGSASKSKDSEDETKQRIRRRL